MSVSVTSKEKGKKSRSTKIGKPIKAFTAVIKEGELMMNFSHGSSEAKDEQGNKVEVFLWVSGDWLVQYKDKEYLIPISENVNALINWINANEK